MLSAEECLRYASQFDLGSWKVLGRMRRVTIYQAMRGRFAIRFEGNEWNKTVELRLLPSGEIVSGEEADKDIPLDSLSFPSAHEAVQFALDWLTKHGSDHEDKQFWSMWSQWNRYFDSKDEGVREETPL